MLTVAVAGGKANRNIESKSNPRTHTLSVLFVSFFSFILIIYLTSLTFLWIISVQEFLLFCLLICIIWQVVEWSASNLQSIPEHGSTDSVVIEQIFDWTDSSYSWTTVINVFHCNVTNILRRYAVDSSFQFVQWNSSVIAQLLAANVFANWCRTC